MNNGGVLLSGWLRKSPPEKKLKRSWKKRWFILKSGRLSGNPNVLEYFKHQASKKALRIISLDECSQIDCNVPIRADKDFVFDIVTKSRTYYFIAESRLEMASWVRCLCDLCGFNHGDTNSISSEQQTFKAVTPIDGTNSANGTIHYVQQQGDMANPTTMPRPETTMTANSKPVANGSTHRSNGHSSHSNRQNEMDNGYHLCNEQSHLIDNPENSNMLHLTPPSTSDTNGYLHLSDCQTADSIDYDPNRLNISDKHKLDERRSSTDSVFTHESTNDRASPDVLEDPLDDDKVFAHKSHFISSNIRHGRLDSMPDAPPPAPPINVHNRFAVGTIGESPSEHTYYNYDDEDEVQDASTRRRSRGSRGRSSLQLQQFGGLSPIDDTNLHGVPPTLQRVDSNSGPRIPSHMIPQTKLSNDLPPEYINTSESRSESTSSTHSHLRVSYNGPSPQISKGQMSPTFPITTPPALQSHYQMPPVSKTQSNISHIRKTHHYNNATEQIIYASPKSTLAFQQETVYDTPPSRPPKPSEQFGPMLDVNTGQDESVYNSPRNYSTSSSSSSSSRAYDVTNSRIKDDKKIAVSPKHCSIIGTINTELSSPLCTPVLQRNVASASNSPLATPELKRLNITPNCNSRSESPIVTITTPQSANSNYDVPRLLRQNEESRQNSTSTESTSGTTSTSSAEVYDIPPRRSGNKQVFAEIDDQQSYERMFDQPRPLFANNGIDDSQLYTAMAGGALSQQSMQQMGGSFGNNTSSPFAAPPPVHRDLKPGRKSLGSDGGSSQGMPDRWATSHESIGSEESMVSPPHTTLKHTNKDTRTVTDIKDSRISPNVLPGRVRPKPGIPVRTPPGATQLNQLPGRGYTRSPNNVPGSAYLNETPVPERPPKPHSFGGGLNESSPVPPRPPKSTDNHRPRNHKPNTSMTSSSADSLKSGNSHLQSHFFNNHVPPAPQHLQDVDKGLQYIEIQAASSSSNTNQPSTSKANTKPAVKTADSAVEYIGIDPDKTMALQKTIALREKEN